MSFWLKMYFFFYHCMNVTTHKTHLKPWHSFMPHFKCITQHFLIPEVAQFQSIPPQLDNSPAGWVPSLIEPRFKRVLATIGFSWACICLSITYEYGWLKSLGISGIYGTTSLSVPPAWIRLRKALQTALRLSLLLDSRKVLLLIYTRK